MPTVYIPALLRGLAGGQSVVEVQGATVREVLDNLERSCPGIRGPLLRPGISVVVDGAVRPLGPAERVGPASEVHFLPAISGGRC